MRRRATCRRRRASRFRSPNSIFQRPENTRWRCWSTAYAASAPSSSTSMREGRVMLHKVVDTEQADVAREQANWLAANAEAMELGFAWVAALLHGGDGANETRGAYQAARTRLAEAGEPAAIDRLGSIFGLASFDLDVLLLGCTAQYIGGVGAPDQNLALSLFASTPAEARALARSRFGADAPLRRFRLIGF